MSEENTLWVIVRSTGEYSDRIETPIRYCLSEADAQSAIELVSIEKQRDAHLQPKYRSQRIHGWQLENGEWLPEDIDFMHPAVCFANFKLLPDADERKAQNNQWQMEYDAACLALGHVDPEGSWRGDDYYYSPVTLWKPRP